MAKKRISDLNLSDVWFHKGEHRRIVALGYTQLPARGPNVLVRIAYQDPYTPPDTFKEDFFDGDQEVEVEG